MHSEESPHIKHPWPKRAGVVLSIGIFQTVIWLLSGLWLLIKWSFAPIALLVDFLVLMPIGKMMLSTPKSLDAEVIDELELPDHVWVWMEESQLRLVQEGYVKGPITRVDTLAKDQIAYTYALVNPDARLGVGLNYLEMTRDTSNERLNDLTFAEFTLTCPDGSTMDLSNQQQVDPIEKIPDRRRYFFRDLSVFELSLLAKEVSRKTGCETDAGAMQQLLHDLPSIMHAEFEFGTNLQLARGYVKQGKDRGRLELTWQGAFRSALRTLWPTSAYFQGQAEQESEAFCHSLGIEPMAIYEQDPSHGTISIGQAIETLEELQAQLEKMTDRIPQLNGFVPYSITCSFNEGGRLSLLDVDMERRRHYPARDYTSSIECFLNFDNHGLECEYSYDAFYHLEKQVESEQTERPSALSSLAGYLPLAKILSNACGGRKKTDVKVTEANLEMINQQPVWTVILRNSASDEHASIELDALKGGILNPEA